MNNVSLVIREAQKDDFEWVESVMQNTLEPYYGGDHRLHAKRIFNAHIAGGVDSLGFFSFEQRMFIAEIRGKKAGIIHLVGKRQATYKISPLIVVPEFQGRFGIGSQLLDHAESYARRHQSRQIYCTIAEKTLRRYSSFSVRDLLKREVPIVTTKLVLQKQCFISHCTERVKSLH